MAQQDASHQETLRALREQVLPWLQRGTASILLGELPLQPPPEIKAIPIRAPKLRLQRNTRYSKVTGYWPEAGLIAVHCPRFGIVLEGEADFNIGITEKMAGRFPALQRGIGGYTLQMRKGSFLVMPPGLPFSDGMKVHWERPHPERAHSTILWITSYTGGLWLHMCNTQGLTHRAYNSSCAHDPRAEALVEMLLEALRERGEQSKELARALLLALILRIEQAYCAGNVAMLAENEYGETPHSSIETVPPLPQTHLVQRARDYIDTHYTSDLSAADIAAHAHVSVSHLNRLFRSELGTSVKAYLTDKRIEMARTLLLTTNLTVQDICTMTGYRHPNYLTYVFTHETGETPLAFKRRMLQASRRK